MNIDPSDFFPSLRQLIDQYFSLDEIRDLYFELGIDPDELLGKKRDIISSLLLRQSRRKELDKLLGLLRKERPNVDWPDLPSAGLLAVEFDAFVAEVQPSITVEGNVGVGGAIGSGASVKADHIAGRDVNVIHVHLQGGTAVSQDEPGIHPCNPIPSYGKLFGRDQEKQMLLGFLTKDHSVDNKRFLTVHGMGGVGKSALVAEVVRERPKNYKPCWVDLENKTNNLADLMAGNAGLGSGGLALNSIVSRIYKERIIVVLDHADNYIDNGEIWGILNRLTQDDKGKVIITSQRRLGDEWAETAVELQTLDINSAVEQLKESWAPNKREISPDQKMHLKAICELLDGHPLSIAIIGSLATRRRDDDLSALRDLLTRTMAADPPDVVKRIGDLLGDQAKGKSTWAAMEVAYGRLPENAKRLLNRLSLFPNTFDWNSIRSMARIEPVVDARMALGNLREHGLIVHNHQIYKLPPVVRVYAREQLSDSEELKQIKKKIGSQLVAKADHSVNFDWLTGMSYLLDGAAWKEVISEFKFCFKEITQSPLFTDPLDHPQGFIQLLACYCLAWPNHHTRQVDKAQDYSLGGKSLLANLEVTYKQVALQLRFSAILIVCYVSKGMRDKAKSEMQQAQNLISSSNNYSEDLQWEIGQINLAQGIYYRFTGEYEKAIRPLKIAQSIFGAVGDALYTAKALSGLATVYYDAGDFQRSLEMSAEVLKIASEHDSYEFARLRASEISNCTELLTLIGRFDDAIRGAEEGLRYYEAIGSIWDYMALLINVAKAKIGKGLLNSAEQDLIDSLDIAAKTGDEEYRSEIYYSLAEMYLYQGEVGEAEGFINKAFQEDIGDLYAATALRIQGQIKAASNDLKGAEESLKQSRKSAQKGDYPYHTARANLELAKVYARLGDEAAKRECLESAELYFYENNIDYYLNQARELR